MCNIINWRNCSVEGGIIVIYNHQQSDKILLHREHKNMITSNRHSDMSSILGPEPSRVTCPSCHSQVTTKIEIETSTETHLMALLLCLIFIPCVCLPYCMESCQNKNHYCPNCGGYVGRYES